VVVGRRPAQRLTDASGVTADSAASGGAPTSRERPPAPWFDADPESPFGTQTLPYGVFAAAADQPSVGVRIGDSVLDAGAVDERFRDWLRQPTLDAFLAAGPLAWNVVRQAVVSWLTEERYRDRVEPHLHPLESVRMLLPFTVADFVDFYSSRFHAENLGAILRPGQPALLPNWRHLPVGYHGRAGTVVVSGTDVPRPSGQFLLAGESPPSFGPSRRLDFEAEVGVVVGVPSQRGTPVGVGAFADHAFGFVLVNDWSARDLQAWEYQPLGPFLGKSFATSISAWVTPLAALTPARIPPPIRDVDLLPYLRDDAEPWGLDLSLEVEVNEHVVSRPPFRDMYWTPAQQLAHVTVNGAHVRTGDLLASGTVSGPRADERGSLIELTWNGERPLLVADGGTRTYLEDGDEVVLRATGRGPGGTRVGLGEVRGRIVPAVSG
jgi:fumarylacetoacetase